MAVPRFNKKGEINARSQRAKTSKETQVSNMWPVAVAILIVINVLTLLGTDRLAAIIQRFRDLVWRAPHILPACGMPLCEAFPMNSIDPFRFRTGPSEACLRHDVYGVIRCDPWPQVFISGSTWSWICALWESAWEYKGVTILAFVQALQLMSTALNWVKARFNFWSIFFSRLWGATVPQVLFLESRRPGSEIRTSKTGLAKGQMAVLDTVTDTVVGSAVRVDLGVLMPYHVWCDGNAFLTARGQVDYRDMACETMIGCDDVVLMYVPEDALSQLGVAIASLSNLDLGGMFVTAVTATDASETAKSSGMLRHSEAFGLLEYEGSTEPGFSGGLYMVGNRAIGMHLGGGVKNYGVSLGFARTMFKDCKGLVSPDRDDRLSKIPESKRRRAYHGGSEEYIQYLASKPRKEVRIARFPGQGQEDYLFVFADGMYHRLEDDGTFDDYAWETANDIFRSTPSAKRRSDFAKSIPESSGCDEQEIFSRKVSPRRRKVVISPSDVAPPSEESSAETDSSTCSEEEEGSKSEPSFLGQEPESKRKRKTRRKKRPSASVPKSSAPARERSTSKSGSTTSRQK